MNNQLEGIISGYPNITQPLCFFTNVAAIRTFLQSSLSSQPICGSPNSSRSDYFKSFPNNDLRIMSVLRPSQGPEAVLYCTKGYFLKTSEKMAKFREPN